MADQGYSTVTTSDGYEVVSNTSTPDEIKKSLDVEDGVEQSDADKAATVSKAASELGKKSAEKRAAEKRAAAKPAEPDLEDDEDLVVDPAKPLGKPRHDPRARIQQLATQRREAEQALQSERQARAALEQRIAEFEAKAKPQKQAAPPSAPVDPSDPEPSEGDFDTYAKFTRSQAEWAARQALKEFQRGVVDNAARAQNAQRLDSAKEEFSRKMHEGATPEEVEAAQEFAQRFPLPWEVQPNQLSALTDMSAYLITIAEHPRALLLHLQGHEDEYQRIASLMDGQQVILEMAKLDGRLGSATTAASSKPHLVSKALPPVRPVTGGAGAVDDDEPSESEPYEVWKRKRDAQERRARSLSR